jgi:hypothetical protein
VRAVIRYQLVLAHQPLLCDREHHLLAYQGRPEGAFVLRHGCQDAEYAANADAAQERGWKERDEAFLPAGARQVVLVRRGCACQDELLHSFGIAAHEALRDHAAERFTQQGDQGVRPPVVFADVEWDGESPSQRREDDDHLADVVRLCLPVHTNRGGPG